MQGYSRAGLREVNWRGRKKGGMGCKWVNILPSLRVSHTYAEARAIA